MTIVIENGPSRPAAAVPATSSTLDPREVDAFNALAKEWWDPNGQMKPLHKLGPARMAYLRDTISAHAASSAYAASAARADLARPDLARPDLARPDLARPGGVRPTASPSGQPLAGLRILDAGCGGGLVAEPLARMGAIVTGIDPGLETIAAARAHAASQGLAIDYRALRIEDVVAAKETFDAVLCLEVVEHIPDVGGFLSTAAKAVRPGGLLIVSTINRTLRSYALAIVAAEYVLGWLPRGTHDWNRFVRPDELAIYLKRAGLEPPVTRGLVLDPIIDRWRLSSDVAVNYFAAAQRPA